MKNQNNKKIILASSSPRRKELLAGTGLVFEIIPSDYEEDMQLPLTPNELAKHLSAGKSENVADKNQKAVVIGADTFISFQGQILGKPHTKQRAREMLLMLSNNWHSVITGFTIIHRSSNKFVSKSVETKVYFKNLTIGDIDDYIEAEEVLEKAGAYAIQGLGGSLVEKIEGDYSNVIGLPIDEVIEALREFDIII